MHFNTNVTIDAEDLALTLDSDEALRLVKIIDTEQQCWNFTFECAKHFVEELERYNEMDGFIESGEDFLGKIKEMLK